MKVTNEIVLIIVLYKQKKIQKRHTSCRTKVGDSLGNNIYVT